MSKYNEFPVDWREISNEEFTRLFFGHVKEPIEFRQMNRLLNGEPASRMITANLFPILGFGFKDLGIAIYEDSNQSKFAKFGSETDWRSFEGKFAAQFRGDNS